MLQQKEFDIAGVGIGPFNLGLAALLDPLEEIDACFLESKSTFQWHPGMMLEGTTLQVPFLADLVTLADPTSRYSFLNYLQAQSRLYKFYFYENFHIPRQEYNDYCQWVAGQLKNLHFGKTVTRIDEDGTRFLLDVYDEKSGRTEQVAARHVVLGTGTRPYLPSSFRQTGGGNLFHSAHFLENIERCREAQSVTVVGSGQSAAEVVYAMLTEQEKYGYQLNWFTRSRGFFPMEYSRLGLEHFSPEYTTYFYRLPEEKRREILPQQDLLYKGISAETISAIYELLYHRSVGGKEPDIRIQALTEVESVIFHHSKGVYTLRLRQIEQNQREEIESEVVVAATGYEHYVPAFLAPLYDRLRWDASGRYAVNENYTLQWRKPMDRFIFVQNGELHTHGVGAPDLGLGAYRNAVIIRELTGREVYPIRKKNVFQQFGLAGNEKGGIQRGTLSKSFSSGGLG